MAPPKIPSKGYIAKKNSHAFVFAYDIEAGDAVWLRCGTDDRDEVLDSDVEAIWPLPEDAEGVREFIVKYGFERITTSQAQPYIRQYLTRVRTELLDPEANREILNDPTSSIGFVRAVKNFLLDLEEL